MTLIKRPQLERKMQESSTLLLPAKHTSALRPLGEKPYSSSAACKYFARMSFHCFCKVSLSQAQRDHTVMASHGRPNLGDRRTGTEVTSGQDTERCRCPRGHDTPASAMSRGKPSVESRIYKRKTYSAVVVVPEGGRCEVKADREGKCGEEDGADKDRVALEQRRVDGLCVTSVMRHAGRCVKSRDRQRGPRGKY